MSIKFNGYLMEVGQWLRLKCGRVQSKAFAINQGRFSLKLFFLWWNEMKESSWRWLNGHKREQNYPFFYNERRKKNNINFNLRSIRQFSVFSSSSLTQKGGEGSEGKLFNLLRNKSLHPPFSVTFFHDLLENKSRSLVLLFPLHFRTDWHKFE